MHTFNIQQVIGVDLNTMRWSHALNVERMCLLSDYVAFIIIIGVVVVVLVVSTTAQVDI